MEQLMGSKVRRRTIKIFALLQVFILGVLVLSYPTNMPVLQIWFGALLVSLVVSVVLAVVGTFIEEDF